MACTCVGQLFSACLVAPDRAISCMRFCIANDKDGHCSKTTERARFDCATKSELVENASGFTSGDFRPHEIAAILVLFESNIVH